MCGEDRVVRTFPEHIYDIFLSGQTIDTRKSPNQEARSARLTKIEEFLTFLKNNSIGAHFFEYRFDVEYSSGERALITLLARFLSKKNEIESIENENVLILLDEPDILLHPEWQRKYILVLIRFFENIYENIDNIKG